MDLFLYADTFVSRLDPEHRDTTVSHELRRNRDADVIGVFLPAVRDVLMSLDNAMPIGAAFGLNGNDILLPVSIDGSVDLIDLDLPHPFDGSAEVVLASPCCELQENPDNPGLSEPGKHELLVPPSQAPLDRGRVVWDVDGS